MRSIITFFVLLGVGVIPSLAHEPDFGRLVKICSVTFPTTTQVGTLQCTLAVCRLESEGISEAPLYVVEAFKAEYAPQILRILEVAHTPVMELRDERVIILYSCGANSTWVTEYTIKKGMLKYASTECIAWNDGGSYRTSDSFAGYKHLLMRQKL